MTSPEPRFLHNGLEIPPRLISTVSKWWIPSELTPGWLKNLPENVQTLSKKWDITFEENIPESNVTLVLLGNSSKLGPVVYKSSPIESEFRSEATALQHAGGAAVSRIYDVDFENSAMIVERIVPGTPLLTANFPDEDATRIFATIAMEFWQGVAGADGLQPLRDWLGDLYRWKSRPERIPDQTIELAREISEELLNMPVPQRLTHGDLHHQNILRRNSGDWAIIDPKGIYGDPAFEIAAWMYNPPGIAKSEHYLDLAMRRTEICADIWGIDRAHLTRWGFVGAVLSAVWSASGTDPDEWWLGSLTVANVLETLLD